MTHYPNSNLPPHVTLADIDARFGDEESLEERQDREDERGDMDRDREVDHD